MRQDELVQQMSDEELLKSLYYSQLILFSIALILGAFLFDHLEDWLNLFSLDGKQIIIYGVIPALLIVSLNLLLKMLVHKRHLDDGGINERIFKDRSVSTISLIAFVVSASEELLFRGVIQTVFGYFIASTTFALVHVRYLRKPVLLISVVVTSFFIGYLYEITGNLYVTITTHFLVDFILGLVIRFETKTG